MAHISGDNTAERAFGSWASFFADAHIVTMYVESAAHACTAHLTLRIQKRPLLVTLRFDGVTELRLDELREQNVLDALEIVDAIDSNGQPCVGVTLDACYGAFGEFRCASVAVTAVETIDALSA
jgi:hypothetical protein